MKRNLTVFTSRTYLSASSGATAQFFHSMDLVDVLGQAKSLRVQVIGSRKTTNARARIRFFESAKSGDARPRDWGTELGAGTVVTALRPAPFNLSGPFLGRLECVLEVEDTAAATQQEFELEVNITAIIEE